MFKNELPLLKDDDLFAVSTDTVIGLAGKMNEQNLERLNTLKKRDPKQKIAILISALEDTKPYLQDPSKYQDFAKKYWPGAYTIIAEGYAFRIPDDAYLQALIKKNGPLYATSCNINGTKPIKDFQIVKETFPNLTYYLDTREVTTEASKIYDWDKKKWIR